MFGERKIIDESSYDTIDEMDYRVVDDIRDEKMSGNSHAGHLCDEGASHDVSDRQMGSAFNTTPRQTPYNQPTPKANAPYPKPTQSQSSPSPKPVMQQYTPTSAPRQNSPVETTVVNGRTFERPADKPRISPAQQKATKIFTILLILGITGSCIFSYLLFPVCMILAIKVMNAAKKCEGDDTSAVDRMIPLIIAIIIAII